MRNYFILLCVLVSMGLHAQIQQNINKPSGTVSNAISEIDSIRFNMAGDEMQVVLAGGAVNSHSIIEIDSVTFAPAMANLQLHTCGADSVHNPALTYGSMTDQEGNVYKTIVIGTQEWMAENLNTSIYRNGEPIPNIVEGTQWIGLDFGAWCYYDNNSEYACPFGKLYNWFAVSDPRKLCPLNWHVPSETEWFELTDLLTEIGIGSGGKMKSIGTQYWESPNAFATNISGFSGLPGGLRSDIANGAFFSIGTEGNWWSSTEAGGTSNSAMCDYLGHDNGNEGSYYGDKKLGYSVRCVKD